MADILILEDNLELALHWQLALEPHQHAVRCAANVDHAMKLFNQQMPDLIITDMLIRDNNQIQAEGGLVFISRINLNTTFNGPILGISGFTKSHYARTTPLDFAKQLGISMALYKPILSDQLIDAVDYLLQNPATKATPR